MTTTDNKPEPYGLEWRNEMIKLDKSQLIALLKSAIKKNNVYEIFLKDINFQIDEPAIL